MPLTEIYAILMLVAFFGRQALAVKQKHCLAQDVVEVALIGRDDPVCEARSAQTHG